MAKKVPTSAKPANPVQPRAKVGDSCSVRGQIIDGNLQCRSVVGNQLKLLEYSDNPLPLTQQTSPLSFRSCQIPDMRSNPTALHTEGIAYPLVPWNSGFTSHSRITIAIVPIDFSDVPGESDTTLEAQRVIDELEPWSRWFTKGRLTFNWITYPKWIRAEGTSTDFNWIHPEGNVGGPEVISQGDIGRRLVAIADKHVDVSKVQVFYFMYPRQVKAIKDSVNFSSTFETSKGNIWAGVYAGSSLLYNYMGSEGQWLMHENIHRFGFRQHAPGYPGIFSLTIGDQPTGLTLWDRLVLDWLAEGDAYCVNKDQLHGEVVTLVPSEREQRGFVGVAVKLNDHKLLILESHRRDVWGVQFAPGIAGITAMVVDTTKDTDRRGEWSRDDGRGIDFERTANYLQFVQYEHGLHPAYVRTWGFELNYLLYPGESFEYEGIHVEFINSGANDSVKLTYTK